MSTDARMHLVNCELIKVAEHELHMLERREKRAFIPVGDPSMGGGQPGAGGPGGDPSQGGGGGGGAPPADPAGGGGAPPMTEDMVRQIVQQAMMSNGGAAGAGGAGPASGAAIKPKIDVNVEIMQVKNMLAKLCDTLGVQIPAQDMTATPDKLMAMAQGQPTTSGAGGQGAGSSIQPPAPMEPMQGASPAGAQPKTAADAAEQGYAYDNGNGFRANADRSDALFRLLQRAGNQ